MAFIYRDVSTVISLMTQQNIGIKNALYSNKFNSPLKNVYGLTTKVINKLELLKEILIMSNLFIFSRRYVNEEERMKRRKKEGMTFYKLEEGCKVNKNEKIEIADFYLCVVMLYDLLYSKSKRIQGGGKIKNFLLKHAKYLDSLRVNLEKEEEAQKQKRQVNEQGSLDLAASFCKNINKYRYMRVNTSRVSVNDVMNIFENEVKMRVERNDIFADVLRCSSLDINNVIKLSFVTNGDVVLQDLSSYLASRASNIFKGARVLDACAAPGSKTLHILELLNGVGYLLACERNLSRAAVLIKRLLELGNLKGPFADSRCEKKLILKQNENNLYDITDYLNASLYFTNLNTSQKLGEKDVLTVEVRICDFLSVKEDEMKKEDVFDIILVDPSCSGTGMPQHNYGCDSEVWSSEENKEKSANWNDNVNLEANYKHNNNEKINRGDALKKNKKKRKSFVKENSTSSACPHSRSLLSADRRLEVKEKGGDLPLGCGILKPSNLSILETFSTSAAAGEALEGCCSSSSFVQRTSEKKCDTKDTFLFPSLLYFTQVSQKERNRILQLSKFQRKILTHALTNFPSAKTVCYSTCSFYALENEFVVKGALRAYREFVSKKLLMECELKRAEERRSSAGAEILKSEVTLNERGSEQDCQAKRRKLQEKKKKKEEEKGKKEKEEEKGRNEKEEEKGNEKEEEKGKEEDVQFSGKIDDQINGFSHLSVNKKEDKSVSFYEIVEALSSPPWKSSILSKMLANFFEWSELCVRCTPYEHLCRGFFLAKFEKKSKPLSEFCVHDSKVLIDDEELCNIFTKSSDGDAYKIC